jgi:hypothetical protein
MLRRSVAVCAFLMILSALMAGSLCRVEGQAAAAQTAPSAAPESSAPAQADAASAKTRAFTDASKPFLADRHVARGMECKGCHGDVETKKSVTREQCLKCHVSYEKLAAKTADMDPNPHSNHMIDEGSVECSSCHHGHKANQNGCSSCHAEITLYRSAKATK